VGLPYAIMTNMNRTYEQLKKELFDPAFAKTSFLDRGINIYASSLPSFGVSGDRIKAISKKYVADPSLDLTSFALDEAVELTICYFIIGLLRAKDFPTKMAFLSSNLPFVDSWGVTDSCPQFIKKPEAKVFIPYFKTFIASPHPFVRRFAYVFAMSFYRDDNISAFISGVKNSPEYYVYMAEAWMLATFAITHFEEVYAYLEKEDISLELLRKTVSKCCDSFRITPEQKKRLKALRSARVLVSKG